MKNKATGIAGEALAVAHYKQLSYKILETNYRFHRFEIDFIAMRGEDLLVFVEVKTRTRRDFGEPESFVSDAQQTRIKEAAEAYILATDWKKNIRFDIVAVDEKGEITLFEDAF